MADEKSLVYALKAKDEKSIKEAIKVYTPYLGTVLYNLAGNALSKEDSEEIIADTFFVLWQNAEKLDCEYGSIRFYLATIAKNFALKRLRDKKENACIDDLEIPTVDYSDEKETGDFLWRAVMDLGEPDSEIFVRYYKFGEKIRTIAKSMSLNISTVKTKLKRGKEKLKKTLSDAEERL